MSDGFRLVGRVPADADVVVTPVYADRLGEAPAAEFLAATGFAGRPGQTAALDGDPVRLVVGLGPHSEAGPQELRRAAAAAARAVRRYEQVSVLMPDTDLPTDRVVGATAGGFLLGRYRFTPYKSRSEQAPPQRLDLVVRGGVRGEAGRVNKAALDRAQRFAEAVLLARDLGNEPGGTLTPPVFAERALEVAAGNGLECEVWDETRIAAERLGGLLGVSRGSVQPPRLVHLRYEPPRATATVAVVGKGVTFDSGGLTLKPNNMMLSMKIDMAGAAAVLAACSALRDLRCPLRVLAWLPLTDNMSGGDATRLGDVLRTRNGTTIEVRNADAEGRLILADALALASEATPDAIVDLATLTDTVPMALGRRYSGLFGTDDTLRDAVLAAATAGGEAVWPLPMDGFDANALESKIADLMNVAGGRYGQSVSAAQFLRQFVDPAIPWAHLDIAGPVFSEDDDGVWSAGATGYGVSTLLELLTTFRPRVPAR